MFEKYYVLESVADPGYYMIDDQIMLTENIKAADKFDDLKFAKKLAKHGDFRVKEVTVEYTIKDVK